MDVSGRGFPYSSAFRSVYPLGLSVLGRAFMISISNVVCTALFTQGLIPLGSGDGGMNRRKHSSERAALVGISPDTIERVRLDPMILIDVRP